MCSLHIPPLRRINTCFVRNNHHDRYIQHNGPKGLRQAFIKKKSRAAHAPENLALQQKTRAISSFICRYPSGILCPFVMTVFRLNSAILFMLLPCVWTPSARCNPAEGAEWRALTHVQQAIGATNYTWNGDSLFFSNSQHSIRFYQGRRKADVDGTTVWLNIQPNGSVPGGDWRLGAVDFDLFQLSVLPQAEGEPKPLRILLDPGHGGDDDGACSDNPPLKEKELTLALAKKIAGHLKKAGMHVDLTRTHDTTLTLDERVGLARKKKADIFLSIHANHADNAEATGVETYVLPPSGYPGTAEGSRPRGWQIGNRNDYHNTLLGFSIHSKLAVQTNATDRGLKRQSFFVLRETSCPAVLFEFGFLSNRGETLKMLTSSWQEQCADAVTAGVTAYAKKIGALDHAVAEKRARDAEANERWRRHLASVQTNAPPLRPAPIPLPAPVVTSLSYAVSSPSAIFRGTNATPVEINTLIDFYGKGTLE